MSQPVVVAVDGSEPARAAAEWAAADARRRRLPLKVVHVCERQPPGLDFRKYCAGTVDAAVARARTVGGGDVAVSGELRDGNVVEALIGESVSADSLVLGSRGLGGFKGLLLGSVSLAVAGHAAGPVVVVREPVAAEHGMVVVGDDGSEGAAHAVAYAVEQARARRATLLVEYAWVLPTVPAVYGSGYSDLLEEVTREECRLARERVGRWRDEHADVHIIDRQVLDHPVPALAAASATADLVVVGSRGMGGFAAAVLGSVGHGLLHRAECPVAVVRLRGQRS